ncbi:carbohydrate sulfotransferase 3 [Hyalella azteca]|uniref:Carbohydrate sulfotransferase 3 n=1 Tax=Hyalella azteca TaxID=294128 RepID=A0A8B7ND84_HYAAZ|nr:carbohydrate sulfotransferase 3 [Hyalella azteca]
MDCYPIRHSGHRPLRSAQGIIPTTKSFPAPLVRVAKLERLFTSTSNPSHYKHIPTSNTTHATRIQRHPQQRSRFSVRVRWTGRTKRDAVEIFNSRGEELIVKVLCDSTLVSQQEQQVRQPPAAGQAATSSSFEPLFHFGAQIFMITNKLFYSKCLPAKKCDDPEFFSSVCAESHVHVLKVIRLSLKFASSLLVDPKFQDLKIVYLARDPRPVIRSRREPVNARWCTPKNLQCYDPRYACLGLDEDLNYARQLLEEFPDRFFFLRYEDLSTKPRKIVEQLWQDLNLTITEDFIEYLQQSTTGKKPKMQANDVTRDSANHAFAWRSNIEWELVKEVQESCKNAITNLGWRIFTSESQLRNKTVSPQL